MKYSAKIVGLLLITAIIVSAFGVSFVFAQGRERSLIVRVEELESKVATLESLMATHTHDYTELTGSIPSHAHDISEITGVIDADTLGGYGAEDFAQVGHAHDYSEITNKPSILTEADVTALIIEQAITREPDYDSGWLPMEKGWTSLEHNLGTTEVLINLMGALNETEPGDPELVLWIHHEDYGGDMWYDVEYESLIPVGAMWTDVTDTHIGVFREAYDWMWQCFRLRMWIIS